MNLTSNSNFENEIELKSFFLILWAYKFLILFVCMSSVVCGGIYSLNIEKKFTSTSIFKLDSSDNKLSLSGDLGSLAGFAGLTSGTKDTLPTEKYKGRIFIEKINKELNFINDPYFNTYNPNKKEPYWKATIKSALQLNNTITNENEALWQTIVRSYLANITFLETEQGTVKITVKHKDAIRAAEISNGIMSIIIADQKKEKDKSQDSQLNYLSKTLASSLNDLELAQAKLKSFAINNSVIPMENFTAESLQLDLSREKLKRTENVYEAISELLRLLEAGKTTQNDYLEMRGKYPIVDKEEFRQILGIVSGISTNWIWPTKKDVLLIKQTLAQRRLILTSEIKANQKKAKNSSKSLKTYVQIEREVKIAEATYTVLLEQVKAQSMLVGFRPSNSLVYEYAAPSNTPSEPNRNVILIISLSIGLFVSGILIFILSSMSKVFYSQESLIDAVAPTFDSSLKPLKLLKKLNNHDLSKMHTRKSVIPIRDLTVEIHKSSVDKIVVTSSSSSLNSNVLARAIAGYMQTSDLNIAIIDFSCREKSILADEASQGIDLYEITEKNGKVSVLMPKIEKDALAFLSNRNFSKSLLSLNSSFDLVFMCADDDDALTLLRAIQKLKVYHIMLAKTRNTKSNVLSQMISLLPVQGLLHE